MACQAEESNKYNLDDNFIKSFKPLIYIQTVIGSVRVNIRYNVISPPQWIQSAYALTFITFTWICFTLSLYMNGDVFTKNRLELAWAILQANIGVILNTAIIITNNFTNRDSNVKLFLTLQRIDRDLKVTGKRRHNTKIYVFNILSIILLLIYHSYRSVVESLFFNLSMAWLMPPVMALFSVEDYETVLFLMILLILHERLAFIKKMLDFGTEIRWQQTLLNIQVHQNIWQAFDGVVEAIRLTERVFRIYVSKSILVYLDSHQTHLVSNTGGARYRADCLPVPRESFKRDTVDLAPRSLTLSSAHV